MSKRLRSLLESLKVRKNRKLTLLVVILMAFAAVGPIGITSVYADPPPGCTDIDKDCLEPPFDECPDQTEDFNGVIDGCPETTPPDPEPPINGGDCVGDVTMAAHWARLMQLDPVFRASGWRDWLSSAGVRWTSIELLFKDARQVEEETAPNIQPLAAGVQVVGSGVTIEWPNILTTDRPHEVSPLAGFQELPTQNNPSVLYTNVELNGQGTIWIDGTNWGQFASVQGCENGTGVKPGDPGLAPGVDPVIDPDAGNPDGGTGDLCLSERELNQRFGIVRNALGAKNGLLYDEQNRFSGAVIQINRNQAERLGNRGWTIQGTNPTVKSAWSPESCR